MKKLLAFAICTMLLFSCLTVACAEQIPAKPKTESGPGEYNSYYAKATVPKREDYYAYVSFTLFATYRFYQSSGEYETSSSASNSSEFVYQPAIANARVLPSRVEDTFISHSVVNVVGYYEK